jgi:predicted ATPase
MAEKSQILISTHSPLFIELIDPEKLPEQLVIVKKEGGQTTCVLGRAKKEAIYQLQQQGITLGEIWRSGELEDVT